MKNQNELRQHLNAVSQTRQITNAMYLLSTARMKKSMQNIDYNIVYIRRLRAAMKDVLSKTKKNSFHHRFIEQQPQGHTLFVVVSSDKGLCGGYNSNVVNLATEKMRECEQPMLCSLGNIGTQMFISRGIKVDYSADDILQHPSFYVAQEMSAALTELYFEHEINQVFVIYTEYINAAEQKPVCRRLVPLLRRDFLDLEYEVNYTAEMLYEPSLERFFDVAVPQYIIGFMYDVFMQAAASENAARMNSMQNATNNADEMIRKLTEQINAARQLAITNELIEIAAATDCPGAV